MLNSPVCAGTIRAMGDSADTTRSHSPGSELRILVSREALADRVEQLAGEITDCYGAGEITIVGVMTGAFVFLADLMRSLSMPIRLAIVSVCSYPGQAMKSQGPRLALPPTADLTGRDVLIVDDILDSGGTMTFLLEMFSRAEPKSLRTCVLLRKDLGRPVDRPDADFAGFDIPDEFVVGYGLDYDDLYRGLPDLCVLDPSQLREGGK